MRLKNIFICVFLHFWLDREHCRGTQPKTPTLELKKVLIGKK